MVASRDIQAGELIYKEDPLAMGPNHTALPCCLDCMRTFGGTQQWVPSFWRHFGGRVTYKSNALTFILARFVASVNIFLQF